VVRLCGGGEAVCGCRWVVGSEGVDVVGRSKRLESLSVLRCRCRDEGGKGGGEFGWNEFQGRFPVEERGPDARSVSDGGFLSQRSTDCSG
jgi:hypothetical protein